MEDVMEISVQVEEVRVVQVLVARLTEPVSSELSRNKFVNVP